VAGVYDDGFPWIGGKLGDERGDAELA
jgi:hypothetical protein